jgi:NADH:quinone reductase (non-electrogenic)
MGERKQVVILGGGFAGVYTALELEKALGRDSDVDVVLVSRENYLVFQPMLPEVISGSIGITDVVSPIRRLVKRTQLHMRDVEAIDIERKVVIANPGFRPQAHLIPYDHLVLALGSVTDFRGMRGLAEHAFPFKNLVDALNLRNHAIRAIRESAIEQDAEFRRELLTFVVAGGGFSGVEAVAELNDFVRGLARSFPTIDPKEIRVVLLHSGDRILPEMAPNLALFAQKILAKRGVDIRFNTRLEAATSGAAVLQGGERIGTRTIVSTVPAFPHPLLEALALPKGRGGKIKATSEMNVEGRSDIWALGDCALVPMVNGELAPPTAQHAIRQAAVAAHNIVASIRGGPRRTFTFTGLGKMGALGHRSAVAEVFGVKISGLLAWFMWRTTPREGGVRLGARPGAPARHRGAALRRLARHVAGAFRAGRGRVPRRRCRRSDLLRAERAGRGAEAPQRRRPVRCRAGTRRLVRRRSAAAQRDDARRDGALPRSPRRALAAEEGIHGAGREPAGRAQELRSDDGAAGDDQGRCGADCVNATAHCKPR